MNSRWIDQYLLRYAVGTIVGAAIIAYLFLRLPEGVRAQAPSFDTWGKVVVLATAGLAFCYIASAPLLVIHVARRLFLSKQQEKKRLGLFTTTFVVVALFLVTWCLGHGSFELSISVAALGALFTLQAVAIVAMWKQRESISRFYRDLAAARKLEVSDIVESYRGIREHGNAYAIVFLESFLGLILSGMMDLPETVESLTSVFKVFLALTGIWVMPASLMLYSAARIENDFVDGKKG